MTRRDAYRYTAAIAAAGILAGPRRTRPLAGALYGWALSRAQGASREHLEATMLRLFHERESLRRLLDLRTADFDAVDLELIDRVELLERVLRAQYGGRALDAILAGVERPRVGGDQDVERLPVWIGAGR